MGSKHFECKNELCQRTIRSSEDTASRDETSPRSANLPPVHVWFGPDAFAARSRHRSRLKGIGLAGRRYRGKPVIGILKHVGVIFKHMHSHLRQRAEEIKRGVWQAGGFPVEVAVLSLVKNVDETLGRMLYRTMLAMETGTAACHPIDARRGLMGGCDKTTAGTDHGRDQCRHSLACLPRADAPTHDGGPRNGLERQWTRWSIGTNVGAAEFVRSAWVSIENRSLARRATA